MLHLLELQSLETVAPEVDVVGMWEGMSKSDTVSFNLNKPLIELS